MQRPVSWQTPLETDALELIFGDGCMETSRADLKTEDVEALATEIRNADPATDWSAKLEQRVAKLTDYAACVAVSSGEAALAHAILGAGVQPGDEVIVPGYAPVSIADVVVSLRAVPVIVDVDETTLHLNVDAVEDSLTDRTRAVIAVHVGGLAVSIDKLTSLAERSGLVVIEDTVGANPGILNRSRGHRANLLCIRMDANSHFPINRGGIVCTTNPETAARIRLQRLPASPLLGAPSTMSGHGISQLAAAWEFVQFATVKERWRRRCQIAMTWSAGFGGSNIFQVPSEIPSEPHCWNQYILRLNLQHSSLSRTELVEELRRQGIGVGIHYLPIHMHERYQRQFGYGADTFPVSRNEFLRELTLPINSTMSDKDVDLVWTTLTSILRRHT
jgi:dTDP-4-amino-4,6-dideoxygalactose transaminase